MTLTILMSPARVSTSLHADAERLADIITSLQRSFMLRLSQDLAKGHVSFTQYFLLGFLVQQGPLNMSAIAARMGTTTAAATGLVDRLEKLDLVRRGPAAGDRRKIIVQPTAAGVALVAEVRDDMIGNVLKIMAHLSPGEQKAWVQIYEKIILYCQET